MALKDHLQEHIAALKSVDEAAAASAASELVSCAKRGGRILVCGNGGSAADAQHFAAELVGRFERDRRAVAAIALTTDTSALTAIGNDLGFDRVFERQVEALGKQGDVLVAISTSGNSKDVVRAVGKANAGGIRTIGLLGRDGGELKGLCDIPVIVQHQNTARIQEAHIVILHFWASEIERSI
jgi:D-sedoheptulose 7-phosphate isomerase